MHSIFEEKTHTVNVWQDKGTRTDSYAAVQQPQNAQTPAQERPKHHGSQKRRVREISGCVSKEVFDEVERMRIQGGKRLSRSVVVAALVTRGIQGHIDMQYGALLEPIIRKTIKDQMTSDTNRVAYLASQAYYSAEEAKILVTKLLSIMIRDGELVDELLNNTRKEARLALQYGNSQG